MTFPIGRWFCPPELFAAAKAKGCNFVMGLDAGTAARFTAQAFCQQAADIGLSVVGNFDFRPPNLLAWFVPIDEPNAHGISMAAIKAFVDKFTAIDASFPTAMPILISLAGDQISNDDSGKTAAWYQQVAALSPRIVFLVNYYVCNRNPDRYLPLHLNAKVVSRLRGWLAQSITSNVWMAAECSWQRLQTQQPQGRCPTADEMETEINEGLGAGATGIVWFPTAPGSATIEGGKPGAPDPGWPGRYDPPVDPSIPLRMVAIANRLNPAPAPIPPVSVVPPLEEIYKRLTKLEAWMAAVQTPLPNG